MFQIKTYFKETTFLLWHRIEKAQEHHNFAPFGWEQSTRGTSLPQHPWPWPDPETAKSWGNAAYNFIFWSTMWYLWVGDRGKSLLFQLVYGLLERSHQMTNGHKDCQNTNKSNFRECSEMFWLLRTCRGLKWGSSTGVVNLHSFSW